MPTALLYDKSGQQTGEVELPAAVFGVTPHEAVVHQAVLAHLAACRLGTAKTKTRAEVRGGGRKPWRQKGTGRARAGSIRSPLWRGGGTTFGPVPRDYTQRLPKKMKHRALLSVLSAAAAENRILAVEELAPEQISTARMAEFLGKLGRSGRLLLVAPELDEKLVLSCRNLRQVSLTRPAELNTYDVLAADAIIFSRAALSVLEGERT
jgi:large subunit ribosomal protein L4